MADKFYWEDVFRLGGRGGQGRQGTFYPVGWRLGIGRGKKSFIPKTESSQLATNIQHVGPTSTIGPTGAPTRGQLSLDAVVERDPERLNRAWWDHKAYLGRRAKAAYQKLLVRTRLSQREAAGIDLRTEIPRNIQPIYNTFEGSPIVKAGRWSSGTGGEPRDIIRAFDPDLGGKAAGGQWWLSGKAAWVDPERYPYDPGWEKGFTRAATHLEAHDQSRLIESTTGIPRRAVYKYLTGRQLSSQEASLIEAGRANYGGAFGKAEDVLNQTAVDAYRKLHPGATPKDIFAAASKSRQQYMGRSGLNLYQYMRRIESWFGVYKPGGKSAEAPHRLLVEPGKATLARIPITDKFLQAVEKAAPGRYSWGPLPEGGLTVDALVANFTMQNNRPIVSLLLPRGGPDLSTALPKASAVYMPSNQGVAEGVLGALKAWGKNIGPPPDMHSRNYFELKKAYEAAGKGQDQALNFLREHFYKNFLPKIYGKEQLNLLKGHRGGADYEIAANIAARNMAGMLGIDVPTSKIPVHTGEAIRRAEDQILSGMGMYGEERQLNYLIDLKKYPEDFQKFQDKVSRLLAKARTGKATRIDLAGEERLLAAFAGTDADEQAAANVVNRFGFKMTWRPVLHKMDDLITRRIIAGQVKTAGVAMGRAAPQTPIEQTFNLLARATEGKFFTDRYGLTEAGGRAFEVNEIARANVLNYVAEMTGGRPGVLEEITGFAGTKKAPQLYSDLLQAAFFGKQPQDEARRVLIKDFLQERNIGRWGTELPSGVKRWDISDPSKGKLIGSFVKGPETYLKRRGFVPRKSLWKKAIQQIIKGDVAIAEDPNLATFSGEEVLQTVGRASKRSQTSGWRIGGVSRTANINAVEQLRQGQDLSIGLEQANNEMVGQFLGGVLTREEMAKLPPEAFTADPAAVRKGTDLIISKIFGHLHKTAERIGIPNDVSRLGSYPIGTESGATLEQIHGAITEFSGSKTPPMITIAGKDYPVGWNYMEKGPWRKLLHIIPGGEWKEGAITLGEKTIGGVTIPLPSANASYWEPARGAGVQVVSGSQSELLAGIYDLLGSIKAEGLVQKMIAAGAPMGELASKYGIADMNKVLSDAGVMGVKGTETLNLLSNEYLNFPQGTYNLTALGPKGRFAQVLGAEQYETFFGRIKTFFETTLGGTLSDKDISILEKIGATDTFKWAGKDWHYQNIFSIIGAADDTPDSLVQMWLSGGLPGGKEAAQEFGDEGTTMIAKSLMGRMSESLGGLDLTAAKYSDALAALSGAGAAEEAARVPGGGLQAALAVAGTLIIGASLLGQMRGPKDMPPENMPMADSYPSADTGAQMPLTYEMAHAPSTLIAMAGQGYTNMKPRGIMYDIQAAMPNPPDVGQFMDQVSGLLSEDAGLPLRTSINYSDNRTPGTAGKIDDMLARRVRR